MMQSKFWLKLTGVALLVHVILIVISILEVTVYAYLINTGKDEAFYTEHANITGPWVSGICGSIIMFLLVRRYVRRFTDRQLTYALMLPVIYVALDVLMLLAFNVDLKDHLKVMALVNGVKLLASLGAYFAYRRGK